MTLGSQTPRPNAGRKFMSSRRRGRFPWTYLLMAVAFIAAVCLGAYLIDWNQGSTGGATGGSEGPPPPGADAAVLGVDHREPRDGSSRPPSASSPDREEAAPNPRGVTPPSATAATRSTPPTSPTDADADAAAAAARLPATGDYARDTSDSASRQMQEGFALIDEGETLEARRRLSGLLFKSADGLSADDAATIRNRLAEVNANLVFSDRITPGDPLVAQYEVQPGDRLVRIADHFNVPYPFIEAINNTPASRLRAGQKIKLIRGPFHARVSKRDFRLDTYLEEPGGNPIYISSFSVGLGKDDSTPPGLWKCEAGKKVVNPDWGNPRGREYFAPDDPKNPLGEFWIGLTGIDEQTIGRLSYGIHGTIEPDSIGKQSSMGCIRLADGDIEQLYSMLEDGHSLVEVVE